MIKYIVRIITLLEDIFTLLRTHNPVEPSSSQAATTVLAPEQDDESFWLDFDEEGRVLRWSGGFIPFPLRKDRRFRFLHRMWQSLGETVDIDEIAQVIGDHACGMTWDAVRMFGNRVEICELAPVRCPFRILQEERGFRMIPRF